MASRGSRGQRGAGTPSDQNHTSNDGASGSDALEHDEPDHVGPDQHDTKEATAARRMRKRETDRVAQREHRRRQREHTQNLEARLSLLTKQPEAAEINKLIQENEELKREFLEQVLSWREFGRNMQTLLGGQFRKHGMPTLASAENLAGSEQPPSSSAQTNEDKTPASGPEETPGNILIDAHQQDMRTDSLDLSLFDMMTSPSDELSLNLGSFPISTSSHYPESRHPARRAPFERGFASGSMQSTDLDQSGWDPLVSLPTSLFEGSASRPLLTPSPAGIPHESLAHRVSPCLLIPPSQSDMKVHEIINQVKLHGLPAAVDPAQPALSDFMFDRGKNTLPSLVKQYIAPLGQHGRTPAFLGQYWLIYLYLMWQALQTKDTFERLPRWLRPTVTQINVPHAISLDLVLWPDMRDRLIQMSIGNLEKVCEILGAMSMHLVLEIRNLQSLSQHELGQVFSDLGNWKLNDEFFWLYPELA